MNEARQGNAAPGSSGERIAAEIGVMALIGLVAALIGPFGTDAMPLTLRFAYWIGGFLIGWAGFWLTSRLTMAAARLLGWPMQVGYALAVPLLAAPIMIVVSWGTRTGGSLFLYGQVVVVGIGFYVLFAWIYSRARTQEDGDHPAGEPEAAPVSSEGISDSALHEELPPGFGTIAALAVEDHYVTVHGTDGAREMLLINLAEAIEKTGAENGVQTHRSWWVAHGAATSARRDGRNWKLLLDSGVEVPVSRANVAAVRTAGWLG